MRRARRTEYESDGHDPSAPLLRAVGLERSFGADDLRLLEALANNAAVALQYDRLEQAVNKLQSLQDQLHHCLLYTSDAADD